MNLRRSLSAAAVAALSLGLALGAGAPALAKGDVVRGNGNEYFLTNNFSSTANRFTYGRANDELLVGDWDGDGRDTLAIRRDNTFYVSNSLTGGTADRTFKYGRRGDVILVGDWNGDGKDTFAVRRGAEYHVKNSVTGGDADRVFRYGRAEDTILVGDWDRDRRDTFAVRRGSVYHVKNALRGGDADTVVNYGRERDVILVGDWDGDGDDTFAVRRGNEYHLANKLRGGAADRVETYGRPDDTVFVGDWNKDGKDTIGLRRVATSRPAEPAPAPVRTIKDGAHRVGSSVQPGVYRAPGGDQCYWEKVSGFGGTLDEIIANGYADTSPIVRIERSDAGFLTEDCGTWKSVEATYPTAPATSFTSGSFVVGGHIKPGTYQAAGGDSCYWERLSGFSGYLDEVIANGYGDQRPIVTISGSDTGFRTEDCGTWRRI
ncbi:hypothetical protein SAMN05216184_12118 [Georgenia satyanarayanai]|uniref:Repeat domain-containing protein n=1 Tax=Georgenia satyanarayanai TaxID=860221 RepID=A0A2Y9ARJ4_9MICO|nr:hypothetical protein [Georgenia satyanarayanai]PYF96298.1 hypothetical protein A8987_12118 [Georgenia satyanarayanai]SSA47080.1 hypothetical protein SAMN05216184_12118 [Georgenia satyanarayanai]